MAKRKKPASLPASTHDQKTEGLFPCSFPIKIFGMADEKFEIEAISIIRKHIPDLKENAIEHRPSRGGKYLAITITVWINNREQLDAIYQDLTKSPHVLMAL